MSWSDKYELFQRVDEIVSSVLRQLPEDAFTIGREEGENIFGRVAYLTIAPNSEKAAPVAIAVPEDANEIGVLVGQDTRFELPVGDDLWALRGKPIDEELRDLVDAVIKGRFREQLFVSRGVIFRSRGFLTIDGTDFESTSSGGKGPPDPSAEWQAIEYQPYEPH